MKKNVRTLLEEQLKISPIQERIKLFYIQGFVTKEMAVITGIPKKLIKSIARGNYVPEGEDYNRLLLQFDESLARLNISEESEHNESPFDIDTENKTTYKLNVNSVTLYKGTDDKNMILTIHGSVL